MIHNKKLKKQLKNPRNLKNDLHQRVKWKNKRELFIKKEYTFIDSVFWLLLGIASITGLFADEIELVSVEWFYGIVAFTVFTVIIIHYRVFIRNNDIRKELPGLLKNDELHIYDYEHILLLLCILLAGALCLLILLSWLLP